MLRDLIQTRGVKQKWLANRIGVSEVTVSNWMREKSNPSKKHLKQIGQALNIPLKDLMP